jgi:hypothetical protein
LKRAIGVMLVLVGTMGCGGGDLCGKQAECSKKAGVSFSETECRNSYQTDREKAASLGCGAQYDDAASCGAALSCDQLLTAGSYQVNCGAKLNAYTKCIQ